MKRGMKGAAGTEGTTLRDTGLPCIVVTHMGVKTGAIRKIPLMRVAVDKSYVLIGSYGGRPKNPVWVYNLRTNPDVEIRDKAEVFKMRVPRGLGRSAAAAFVGRRSEGCSRPTSNIRKKRLVRFQYLSLNRSSVFPVQPVGLGGEARSVNAEVTVHDWPA